MADYRNRTTGEVKSQSAWKRDFANTSLPRVWNDSVLDALNLDPVLTSSAPSHTAYQYAELNGVEQNSSGDWVQSWRVVDKFADDADGTKAEKEAAYQATLDARLAEINRAKRNDLLAETDYFALTDVTLSAEMTTYRQNLRDLPTNDNWPNLTDSDWPIKP